MSGNVIKRYAVAGPVARIARAAVTIYLGMERCAVEAACTAALGGIDGPRFGPHAGRLGGDVAGFRSVALGRPGSTWVELSERITILRSAGAGYVEAWLPELDYPYLAIGFQADYAVVHLFAGAERVLLLGSDGTACSDEPIEVPIPDETGILTADFVIDTDRAFQLMHTFILNGLADHFGTWHELSASRHPFHASHNRPREHRGRSGRLPR
jgi:hypothetical protein